MSTPNESYLKVHYELRPAKQVERRMLIDAFQLLAQSGFSIRDYQYTGMGSIYFVDFSLMHRLLGINRMLSVEISPNVRKRVEFNKPFARVDTKIAPIGDVIPTLSKELQHILWLDYDGVIQKSHLQDISLATTFLSVGSMLLVTVDVEPDCLKGPASWLEHFQTEGGDYFDSSLQKQDFGKSKLARRNIELIERAIQSGLTGRSDVQFIPIFNFLYRDGHEMLTVGGMIGTRSERRRIAGSGLADTDYYRETLKEDPCWIKVPKLTRKERQHLDAQMPCPEGWSPSEFELSAENVAAYQKIYRYCPSYAELLL
jgi:hypothetical protein